MELIIILTSFLVAAFIALFSKYRVLTELSSALVSIIALVGSLIIAIKVSSAKIYSPFSFFTVDALSSIVILIIAFVGLATTIYSIKYLRQETARNVLNFGRIKQYFILLNLFVAAMFLAITTSNPIFAWISIEATTLSTAFLISFYNKPSAMEAAWKYLIINSIGLLLGFFGTLLYFTSIDLANVGGLVNWQLLMSNVSHLDPLIAKIAFIFVLIGYGTKVGFAPMHTWLPDAHSKAPAPVSALLSGVLLNVAFITVLRFKAITDLVVEKSFTQNLFIIFGVISIVIAALIIFTQKNYKRLLAYSSIENMGIIALGFGFGGLGIFAAILHMIYHSLLKSTLFLSAGTILLKYGSTKIAKIKGALNVLPITSILFLAGFFAITGAPPFGIFLTKIYIVSAGIKIHPIVSVIVLFLIAILFIGFFKHASRMFFGEKSLEVKEGEESIWLIIPPFALIIIALYLSFNIPQFLSVLINEVVLHY
ncbi:MAG: proton-conducting transporter membrane subunit [Candidatus Gracilibacteria bacterium]|jgi:hydrogenase-4 component F